MFDLSHIKKNYRSLSLYWDFFIFFISIANLSLILFDLTYLSFRSFYYKNLYQVSAWYDGYLGIQAHPTTTKYQNFITRLKYAHTDEEALELQKKLYKLSEKIVENNPFEKSGLSGNLALIQQKTREKFESETNLKYNIYNLYKSIYRNIDNISDINLDELDINVLVLQWLWSGKNRKEIQKNITFYQEDLEILFETNYIRHYGINGDFIDHFYKLDLPFYSLFLVEFLIHWYISIRRKKYIVWFLFPLYRWYDVISLIPAYQFRFFRLFRIISIYTRIRNNKLTYIGNDIISNTIAKYTNVVKEELSDMVSLRILTEIQEEIQQGQTRDLYIAEPLEKNREELKNISLNVLYRILKNQSINHQIRLTLEKSLVESASKVGTLKMVPNFLKETLTKQIGLSIFDSMQEVLLNLTKRKDKDIADLIDSIFDELICNLKNEELNELFHKVLYEIIEKIKKNISEKKWKKDFQA